MPMGYCLHIRSHLEYSLDIVAPILRCGIIPKICFPARLPPREGTGEIVVIETPEVFTPRLLEEWQLNAERKWVRLFNMDYTEFSISLDVPSQFFPATIVNQCFKDKHLKTGVVDLQALKQTILEVAGLIEVSDAKVWDQDMVRYPADRITTKYRVGGKSYTTEIGWLSYFGPELYTGLGRERFDRLVTCYEKYEVNGGMMVVLQEEPYNADNPAHRARELQAIRELGLEELHPPSWTRLLKKKGGADT